MLRFAQQDGVVHCEAFPGMPPYATYTTMSGGVPCSARWPTLI